MKKIMLYLMGIVAICFIIPILGTIPFESKPVSKQEQMANSQNQISTPNTYDYQKYNTISILHVKDGSIESMKLDDYLYGVVAAEMPVDFEKEALKAQAVVARTYTIYKIIHNNTKHGEAAICDDSKCCQAWISKEDRFARWEEDKRQSNWDKIVEAVNSTQGKIITYQGEPINAFFHSNSGGETEMPINVWGGSGYPYLQAVETAGEDAYSQYYSEVILTKGELEGKVKEKYPELQINWEEEKCLEIVEYTEGQRVKTFKVGNINLSGVEARTLFGLKSANFSFAIEQEQVKFQVKGYGHGVGMSQTGADSMAKKGSDYQQIIQHFYTGVEIVNM